MPEERETSKTRVAFDSAIILTITAAILYFFGIAFRTARLAAIGIPPEFARPWSVNEYLLVGGIFVALLAPLLLLPDLVLSAWPSLRRRLSDRLAGMSYLRIGVLIVYAAFVVLIIMLPIAQLFGRTTTHYRVSRLVLKPGVTSELPVVGAYYVSGTETDIVLMDKWADPAASVILLARDDVTAIVLKRERSKSR